MATFLQRLQLAWKEQVLGRRVDAGYQGSDATVITSAVMFMSSICLQRRAGGFVTRLTR